MIRTIVPLIIFASVAAADNQSCVVVGLDDKQCEKSPGSAVIVLPDFSCEKTNCSIGDKQPLTTAPIPGFESLIDLGNTPDPYMEQSPRIDWEELCLPSDTAGVCKDMKK